MLVHSNDKLICGQRFEFGHVVAQIDKVVGHNIVLVRFVNLIGQGPAFGYVTQSKQVLGQLDFRRQIILIELQRLTLISSSFSKPIVLRQFSSD